MYRFFREFLIFLMLLTLMIFTNFSEASASPWTLEKNKMALTLAYDYQSASHEFLENGDIKQFPLSGISTSNSLRVGGRYGLTKRLELALDLGFKDVTYAADPIIIEFPEDAATANLPVARASVMNFTRRATGLSDIYARFDIIL